MHDTAQIFVLDGRIRLASQILFNAYVGMFWKRTHARNLPTASPDGKMDEDRPQTPNRRL